MSHGHKIQLLLAATLITAAMPAMSFAASGGSSVTFPKKRLVSYSAPIAELSNIDESIKSQVLNWSQPSIELTFDLSEADIVDDLEMLLTADPMGRVNKSTAVSVQFNNDAPVRIVTRGQGFDSRIRLNPARVRAKNNVIKITYETPRGESCVLPEHGAWLVDLKHSKLVVKGRAKSRALQLREVEMRLNLPAVAPRTVGLIAKGGNATTLEALAAQGIGLRMDNIPNFTTRKGAGDFEVIMAPRHQLHAYTDDKDVLDSSGPRIFVPRGRPMRLFITGDTDEQILETVKSFATFKLPKSRRQLTSLGEMRMQPTLGGSGVEISGKQRLSDIPGFQYGINWDDKNWAARPQALRFNVADPAATSGKVILKLSSGSDVAADSKLRIALNGELIGSAALDTARQTVSFDILPGALHGADNVLTLTPELNASQTGTCAANQSIDAEFHIGSGSAIVLNTTAASPITDLSRMAATGAPFSDYAGKDSYIALPRSAANYNASLKVLAQLAKASSKGLIDANYDRTASLTEAGNRHILVIDDRTAISRDIRSAAPSAFSQALKGKAMNGENLAATAYGQYADAEGLLALKAAATQHAKMSHVNAGGVATLFGSQNHAGRVIGIISNTPGQSFTRAADYITQTGHWNELEGGVARWNNRSVLLAQTASPISGYTSPAVKRGPLEFPSLPDLMADINWPDADGLKQFGVETVDKIKMGFASFLGGKTESEEKPQIQMAASSTAPVYSGTAKPKSRAFIDRMTDNSPHQAKVNTAGYSGQARMPAPMILTPRANAPKLRGPISSAPVTFDWKDDTSQTFSRMKAWAADLNIKGQVDILGEKFREMNTRVSTMSDFQFGSYAVKAKTFILFLALGIILFLLELARPKLQKRGRKN